VGKIRFIEKSEADGTNTTGAVIGTVAGTYLLLVGIAGLLIMFAFLNLLGNLSK